MFIIDFNYILGGTAFTKTYSSDEYEAKAVQEVVSLFLTERGAEFGNYIMGLESFSMKVLNMNDVKYPEYTFVKVGE